jgi:hypothetical protein
MDNDDERAGCCPRCGGEGFLAADCFEDICCCATPELEHDVIPCPVCP